LTSGESYYVEGATGHCCLKPKLNCPLGVPHPNATCGDNTIPNFRDLSTKPDALYCPSGSHSCIRWSFGGSYETSLCCPIACSNHEVYNREKNRCYPVRNYGDRCEINDQCRSFTGVCDKGICSCDKDFSVEGGTIGYQYCRRVCATDEISVANDRCAPKLKLGDVCDPTIASQCPINAYCSDKKICDCYCGYLMVDGSCAQQPTCPAIEGSKNQNFFDLAGSKVVDFTLCRIPGAPKSTLASVVETCPKDHYCSGYVPEYGLCCPMPAKPFCPDGSTPGDKCDPKSLNQCGASTYCNRYLNPAGNDSTTGYVCCHLQTLPVAIPLRR